MSNLHTIQLSDELIAHPERWIEAREQQPQQQQLHDLQRAAPTSTATATSGTLTLPTSLASEASQRNRNRNRIRDQLHDHNPDCIRDEHRDLIRGSPQSRVPVPTQTRDLIRHLHRDQIEIQPRRQTQDRSQSRSEATITTPPAAAAAPIDIGIDSATSALSIDTDTPFAFSLHPPSLPFKPPTPFREPHRGSASASPQSPRPPHPNRHKPDEDELRALAAAAWKRADRQRAGEIFNEENLRTLADETRERMNRRNGRGVSQGENPPFVPFVPFVPTPPVGPRIERPTGKRDTIGVYITDHGPKIGLEALRRKMPLGWTSPRREQRGDSEEIELPERIPRGGGCGSGTAQGVVEWRITTDAMAAIEGRVLETKIDTAVEDADAEWVLVPATAAPAPAATATISDAASEDEITITIDTSKETEWCVVTTTT